MGSSWVGDICYLRTHRHKHSQVLCWSKCKRVANVGGVIKKKA